MPDSKLRLPRPKLSKHPVDVGQRTEGAILAHLITTSIVTSKTRNVARGYDGEADVFLVHCPDRDEVYVVPGDEAPRWVMSLRLESARNGQRQRVNLAADYALPA